MKRYQVRSRLIGLGAATSETKGAAGIYSDEVLKRETPGLSAE